MLTLDFCLDIFIPQNLFCLLLSRDGQRLFSLSVPVYQHFELRIVQPPIFVEVTSLEDTSQYFHYFEAETILTSNIMSTFL